MIKSEKFSPLEADEIMIKYLQKNANLEEIIEEAMSKNNKIPK